MTHDLAARFRDAFAGDLATAPPLTLRQADAIDSYGSASPRDCALDAVSDGYLEKYASGLPHLDPASWRHYLPAFADFALRHLGSPTVAVGSLIDSLRPPDRIPARLASLTDTQEALVRDLLELLAFSADSTWQAEACQALEEWWIDDPLYRAKAGKTGAA